MFGKFEQFLPDAVFQEAVMRANDDEVWGSRAANLPPMASWKLSEPPSLRRPADYSKARQVFVTNQGWTRDLARSVNTCETMQGQKEASLSRYAGRPCVNWPSSFILNKHYIMPRLFRSWESAQWTPYETLWAQNFLAPCWTNRHIYSHSAQVSVDE